MKRMVYKEMVKRQFSIGLMVIIFSAIFSYQKVKAETEVLPQANGSLIFSEVLPDPDGDDKLGEFIEIQNISALIVNLTGWKIEFNSAASQKIFEFPAGELKAGEHQTFYYQETKIQFTNSGGEIFLYAPSEDLIDHIIYPKAEKNKSWARTCAGESWQTPSPGVKNPSPMSFDEVSISPSTINFTKNTTVDFSASISTPCVEIKSVKVSLPSPIAQEFFLTPSENGFVGNFLYQKFMVDKAQIIEFDISVIDENDLIYTQKFSIKFCDDASAIAISEIYPNPLDGQDEFIELFNQSSRPVDLTYYFLDDSDKGSKPFELSQTILPWSYLSFYKSQTKIALNNDGDCARLLSPESQIIDNENFKTTKQGWSYSFFGRGWRWSEISTPNEKNQEKIYPSGIFISEILPNPKGDDTEFEFIEFYNSMDIPIDLSGWILSDTTTNYLLQNIAIASKSYLAIFSRDSKISLKNSADWAVLLNPRGDIVSKIYYSFDGQEDQSFALINQNFFWTLSPTPGAGNVLKGKEKIPVVEQKIENVIPPEPERASSEKIESVIPLTKIIITTTTKTAIAKPSVWQSLGENLAKLLANETTLPSVKAQIQASAVLGAESQRLTNHLIFVIIKYASIGLFYLGVIKIWRHIIRKIRLIRKE